MRAKPGSALLVGVVAAVLLSSCLVAKTTNTQTVTAPVSGVTGFGTTFSMDEGRLVVRGVRAGTPEIYVFDASGSGWVHTGTITRPGGGTPAWGTYVAVSGDTIAISDTQRSTGPQEQYGTVELYKFISDGWQPGQILKETGEFTVFGAGVWLSGTGLVIRSDRYCDSTCSIGEWTLYQRSGTVFKEAYTSRPQRSGIGLSVGVDQGRIALGNPGYWDYDSQPSDNGLMVFDANLQLPAIKLDEIVPLNDPFGPDPLVTDLFRKVDLQGDVLAYESRSETDRNLHIRRWNGSSYVEEATFAMTAQSAGVAVLPGVVLVANPTAHVWQTYVYATGTWQRSSNLTVPDQAAGNFQTPPVAVGNKVAIRGSGVVYVQQIEAVDVPTS